jgi:mRNA interferase RelE/StbE
MARYDLVFKKSVAKDLRAIQKQDVKRIMQRILSLADEPRPTGCEQLSSQQRYRVRQGAYRIIYEINEDRLILLVVKIGHRREVYRSS